MSTIERLVLPDDLLMSVVGQLPSQTRQALGGEADDVVLTRPRARRRGLVVDAEMALLLQTFRSPTTVPEAVLLHAVRTDQSAGQVLESAFPMLRRLEEAHYLVREVDGGRTGSLPLLAPGSPIGDWVVRRSLQVFDDSDVYAGAHRLHGDTAALKVVRPGAPARTARLLRRERQVLDLLAARGFAHSPRVLDDGGAETVGPSFLAVSWAPGATAFSLAAALRRDHGAASPAAFRVCARIVATYADLHARGIVHGDVHPANILVDGRDHHAVTLIDFGLASVLDGAGPGAAHERGGIGWAFEPELAAAGLAGRGDVAPTAAGEQYSLAALCYFLLTGAHHHEPAADREATFRRLLDEQPRRLSELVDAEPGSLDVADAGLLRALHRDPAGRFPSLTELADCLHEQADRLLRATSGSGSRSVGAVDLLRGLSAPPVASEYARRLAPRASVNHGAAGIAFALLRLASLRGDERLFAAADGWTALAAHGLDDPGGFADARVGITPQMTHGVSLYHSSTGVHLVDALVAHALGDYARAERAVSSYLALATPAAVADELVFGAAGLLRGGAMMLAALRSPAMRPTAARLRGWLRARCGVLAAAAVAELGAGPAPLGLAHGLAGPVLAVMQAEQVLGDGASPAAVRLAALLSGQVRDRGTARSSGGPGLAHSWCNGSAGLLLAVSTAAAHTSSAEARTVATSLAEHTATYAGRNASLCCGSAGVGSALLVLHRLTGEARWLGEARRLGAAARAGADYADMRAHSMVKGALGSVLLDAELARPEPAAVSSLSLEWL